MEGRLLARARARQEQIRSDNKAEADRRRREIHEKYPAAAELDVPLLAEAHIGASWYDAK